MSPAKVAYQVLHAQLGFALIIGAWVLHADGGSNWTTLPPFLVGVMDVFLSLSALRRDKP